MASLWTILTDLSTVGWVMIMIVAVVAIQGIVSIAKMCIKHRERMAMIAKGMRPDPDDGSDKSDET